MITQPPVVLNDAPQGNGYQNADEGHSQNGSTVPSFDLAAEALVLTVGLFPTEITRRDGREAAEIPKVWYRRSCDTLRATRPAKFKMFGTPDLAKAYDRLRLPVPDDLTHGMEDPELVGAFLTKLEECRGYVQQHIPVLHIETFTGPEFVAPSFTGAGEAWSLMALIGQRDRLMDEVAAGTLTSAQAEAFGALFPGLLAMVKEFLSYERGRMVRSKENASQWVQSTLRVLLGMAPDAYALTSPADESPEAPAQPNMPDLQIDFRSQMTRQQRIDAPTG